MSVITSSVSASITQPTVELPARSSWSIILRSGRVLVGGGFLLIILLLCLATLPWTLGSKSSLYYASQTGDARGAPVNKSGGWFGYDALGRSMLGRCLLGGTISLAVGAAAATISVILGTSVGLLAGYRGGWIDSALMRLVDILYGLPYILLVILFKIAFEAPLGRGIEKLQQHLGTGGRWFDSYQAANLIVLFSAIGLVSWLTLARVVRGQVLSLRAQPFIEACRAMGIPQWRIFTRHILPNLVGPITVYATLTVPSAILQESFLSFLSVGINPPLPTWGSLASDAIASLSPVKIYWWMLLFPCLLLVITLLSLNFVGDGLRDVFDPKREQGKL
jgi:ABC-type dipeptide/oligopeptide/nickel transport system permease subunit